nr:RNA-directed DNA polymerase, eukaryota [Tanacetum cinerariifolium]
MIRKQVGDLSTHTTKYTSPALTKKVFANMRRVGKGFSGVETPLFEGVVSVADDIVPTAVDEPSIPSPTPPTPPPQPSQDQPLTSQDAGISMNLLQNLMDTCITLTRRVEHLELNKITQALEITKLKQKVKKLERRKKLNVLKLRRLKRVGSSQRIDTLDDTVMDDERKAESQAEIYKIDLEHAKKILSIQEEESKPAEIQEVVDLVTTAKIITEVGIAEKGVVIKDPQETAPTSSTIIHSEAKSKDKGKGILVEEPKPLKKKAQIKQDEKYATELEAELNKNIDWDEVIDHVQRKQKVDKAVKRYQALKRKPQTEAQARKNMMIYLKNVAGFKMDYFKGITYDDIRPIFEKHFDSNKLDEEVEELKRHLQIVPNDEDDVYIEATPLAHKVKENKKMTKSEQNRIKSRSNGKRGKADNVKLRYLFPRIYALDEDKDCSVAAKLQGAVNLSLRRHVRGGAKSQQLAHLQELIGSTILANAEDRWLNLLHRGVHVPSLSCPICSSALEDTSHLLFSCGMASDVVRLVCRWLGSKSKAILEGVFYFTWWCLWNFKNQLLFAVQKPRKDVIFDDIVGDGGDEGLMLPRSMRLDVPKFSGDDPERWIFAITDYFLLLNTPVDQRL